MYKRQLQDHHQEVVLLEEVAVEVLEYIQKKHLTILVEDRILIPVRLMVNP